MRTSDAKAITYAADYTCPHCDAHAIVKANRVTVTHKSWCIRWHLQRGTKL